MCRCNRKSREINVNVKDAFDFTSSGMCGREYIIRFFGFVFAVILHESQKIHFSQLVFT